MGAALGGSDEAGAEDTFDAQRFVRQLGRHVEGEQQRAVLRRALGVLYPEEKQKAQALGTAWLEAAHDGDFDAELEAQAWLALLSLCDGERRLLLEQLVGGSAPEAMLGSVMAARQCVLPPPPSVRPSTRARACLRVARARACLRVPRRCS